MSLLTVKNGFKLYSLKSKSRLRLLWKRDRTSWNSMMRTRRALKTGLRMSEWLKKVRSRRRKSKSWRESRSNWFKRRTLRFKKWSETMKKLWWSPRNTSKIQNLSLTSLNRQRFASSRRSNTFLNLLKAPKPKLSNNLSKPNKNMRRKCLNLSLSSSHSWIRKTRVLA